MRNHVWETLVKCYSNTATEYILCGLVCSLRTVACGSSMLLISSPGAQRGSMGLKGAVSSVMEAYKCWSLWSLPPAACWSGHEEQLTQRQEDEALRAGKRYNRWGTAREEVGLCVDGGWGWIVSLWYNFYAKLFYREGLWCFCVSCNCDFRKRLSDFDNHKGVVFSVFVTLKSSKNYKFEW